MMIKTEYTKVKRIIGVFILFLITTCQRQILANEQQESIRPDWKKDTGSSLGEAEVNRFDVPSGAVLEVKGPKDGLIRVTGNQPTFIYGAITSSNPVYVINPNGVVVGPGTTINDNLKTPHINRKSQKIETSDNKKTEKRKKEMEQAWKMAYDFVEGPGVKRPNWISLEGGFSEIQETGDIYISCGNNVLYDYIWLGVIRIGGLYENKDEQGSFRRNEATIFPNNPQSSTNPQQNP
jgi:filamentous hemagglutinin family protein